MQITDLIDEYVLQHVVNSRRSWWCILYKDETTKYEWQEHVGGSKIILPSAIHSSTSEWENTSHKNMQIVALICPNGQVAGFNEPRDDSILQLKTGFASFGLIGDNDNSEWCKAHILGAVTDEDGNCDCAAWEPLANRLITFRDNVYNFSHYDIGKLAVTSSLQLKI